MVGYEKYQEINRLLNARLAAKKVLIAVHRGAWGGNIIENTIPAYRTALDMGADMFECDLSLSTDGVLYAIHDGGELRLFGRNENIKSLSSAEIDSMEYRNCIGEHSGQKVQRFEEVLQYFTHGELFNIDRSWPALSEVDAVMRKHPEAIHQAVIKSPVQTEYLDFFQQCPQKYMYMPIVYSMKDIEKVLSYSDINVVGVEAIVKAEDSELFQKDNIKWMHDQGLFVWINTIMLGKGDVFVLSGGYHDNMALLEGAGSAWGTLIERGYNVLQTDWPFQLNRYRTKMIR